MAGEAFSLAEKLRAPAPGGPPAPARAAAFRRRKEVVRDLDFVASTNDPRAVGDFFVKLPQVESVTAHGPTKVSVRLQDGTQCDLRLVTDEEYPFALHPLHGQQGAHHIALRNRALDTRGWSINGIPYQPLPRGRPRSPSRRSATRRSFYRALGLDYIAPELRENLGEIDAAATGKLPELVELENLRGTFHCHTTRPATATTPWRRWPDAAQALGLQYHSASATTVKAPSRRTARTPVRPLRRATRGNRAAQRALQKRRHEFPRLFAGVECDLLKDGSLDFPDEVLASLDYVVVSIHAAFTAAAAGDDAPDHPRDAKIRT